MQAKSITNRDPDTFRDLEYPFQCRWAPAPGRPFEVAAGVHWLRMPIPGSLDHINLWLLEDGDDWVIVDSGVDHPSCKAVWESVFDGFLSPSRVSAVIVTHFHMDHIGLASWLAIKCECPIKMTRGEFDVYHRMVTRDQIAFEQHVKDFYHQVGFDEPTRDNIAAFFKADPKPKESRVQPEQVQFLSEDDCFNIGKHQWRVVTGNGHSPEHACLYCEESQLLISGDQSLPRISSNVSVYPASDIDDPLGDWLDSCRKLQALIPASTLVLPAHQEPFRNNPTRMQQMLDEHEEQLTLLSSATAKPMSAVQARSVLFNRKLDRIQQVMATGETMAHLRHLRQQGRVRERIDVNGVAQYQS